MAAMLDQVLGEIGSIYVFIHYTPSNPQISCVAADILWQPSSLAYDGSPELRQP